MPEYDNNNSGALFKNDRKERPNQPDYKGSLEVDGTDYWVSAWIKKSGPMSKNPGSTFMSLAVEPKEERAPKPPTQRRELNDDGDGFDDIPF